MRDLALALAAGTQHQKALVRVVAALAAESLGQMAGHRLDHSQAAHLAEPVAAAAGHTVLVAASRGYAEILDSYARIILTLREAVKLQLIQAMRSALLQGFYFR